MLPDGEVVPRSDPIAWTNPGSPLRESRAVGGAPRIRADALARPDALWSTWL
jgi:hypothetical protein